MHVVRYDTTCVAIKHTLHHKLLHSLTVFYCKRHVIFDFFHQLSYLNNKLYTDLLEKK